MAETIFSLLILIPCILPFILGVLGLWLFRRWSMRGFQCAIPMDGATCLKANDGSVLIRKRTFFSWFAFIFLGLFLLGYVALLWSNIDGLLKGEPTITVEVSFKLLLGVTLVGAAIVTLSRLTCIPSVVLDVGIQMLVIGRGSSSRQIHFSTIKRVVKYNPKQSFLEMIVVTYGFGPQIGIGVITNKGETIQLGTVSGSKAHERANTIAQLTESATGVSMPQRSPTNDRST